MKYVIVLPFAIGTKGVDRYYGRGIVWGKLENAIVFSKKKLAIATIKLRIGTKTSKWQNAVIQPVAVQTVIIGNKEGYLR